MRRSRAPASIAVAILTGGCDGMQSALDPAGLAADRIATISWILFAGGVAIFVFVMALTLYAVWARPERRNFNGNALVIGGGLIFPVIVLSILLIYTVGISGALTAPADKGALRIEVIGKQWWWEVHYLGPDGEPVMITANEIRIPTGRPIEFVLRTTDVIHSFWVPNLAGKLDMIPGHVNRLVLTAQEPGIYRGQCAEYCGLQHALMALFVVAEPPDVFARWFERQKQPAEEPHIPFLVRGRNTFLAGGCGACHTVRGLDGADGQIGPDLTHVGSRLSLAAGTLDNNIGNLAGWIVDSQHLKPGNGMPPYRQFDGETLRALAAYLESLE